jgi:hypothetical protein
MKLGINSYTFMWSIAVKGVNLAYPGKAARPANLLTPLGLLEKAHRLVCAWCRSGRTWVLRNCRRRV